MMTKFLFLLFFVPAIALGQNSAYLGAGMISSFANTTSSNDQVSSNNLIDFGLYYGNNLSVNNYLETVIEVFYLNNRVVLAKEGNNKFELHQNIGFALKPGYYYEKHSIHLSVGILAVYVFDKDEQYGNQLDRFDESYFYGLEYNYDITPKVSYNFGFFFSEFKSISNWTNHTLTDFSVLQLSLYYKLY